MAKQEISDKQSGGSNSGKGGWKESMTSSKPEGDQINERIDGFRARKEAMHSQDGKNK